MNRKRTQWQRNKDDVENKNCVVTVGSRKNYDANKKLTILTIIIEFFLVSMSTFCVFYSLPLFLSIFSVWLAVPIWHPDCFVSLCAIIIVSFIAGNFVDDSEINGEFFLTNTQKFLLNLNKLEFFRHKINYSIKNKQCH